EGPPRAMSVDYALPIARQIAEALEAAHEQGIVHRDLKPANIKVRPDGTVKVLDFGLAKAMDAGPDAPSSIANSPTFTAHATELGMIIGTAAYMAPEQARGKAVDRRADIWAFGAVLYEMLTGKRAFEGDEISDVLASVLKSDPAWAAIPDDVPPSIRRLLHRCLEKDPRKRLSAIGDARFDLDEQDVPAAPIAAPAASGHARRSAVTHLLSAAGGALVVAIIALMVWSASGTRTDLPVRRFSMLAPPGEQLYPDSTGVAISPDGTMIAFVVGREARSETELWVRSLDSLTARRLDDADGATLPFWSPDSRRIGFFTNEKLKTIAASGGRAEVLADLGSGGGGRGAAWSRSNVIIYAPDASGPLYRIPAAGGTPAQLTTLDASRHEYGHRFPTFLPDGDHFLYAALPGRNGKFDIFAGSLSHSGRTLVGSIESAPVYAAPGYLLYERQGVLAAQAFDAGALRLLGDPVALDDEPSAIMDPALAYTAGNMTSISATGSLAYYSASSANTVAEWYDALGRKTGTLALPPGHYEHMAISPDGTQAVFVRYASPSESALWLVDLNRGSASPLTSRPGQNDWPVWSPDGTKIVFTGEADGAVQFFIKTVGDATPEQPFFQSPALFKSPTAWSPDGRWILVSELDPVTEENVWLLPVSPPRDLKPLVMGPTRDNAGSVSPDGRWFTYVSDITGRFQLYTQSFPTPGHRLQISDKGAITAWWTKDGRQLIFQGDDTRTLWRVDVSTRGDTLHPGTPTLLATLPPNIIWLDASPDRQHFLALAPERSSTGSMTIVQNWRAALAGR
ncbi:MAG: protein kinase domain-containing protein, partial [Vicinamibacterales bacterium]